MTKPLPCPVCYRSPVITDLNGEDWMAWCRAPEGAPVTTVYHEIDAYGKSRSQAVRIWNKLVGKKA